MLGINVKFFALSVFHKAVPSCFHYSDGFVLILIDLYESRHRKQINPINPYSFDFLNCKEYVNVLKSRKLGINWINRFSVVGLIKINRINADAPCFSISFSRQPLEK